MRQSPKRVPHDAMSTQTQTCMNVKPSRSQCDILLILRTGLSSNLNDFLNSTVSDSLVSTILRKMIDDLDYSVFDEADLCLEKEKKLKHTFSCILPVHENLDEASKFIALIEFHCEYPYFFDLYDNFSIRNERCEDCGVHVTTVYVLDDLHDGYIMVKKRWACDEDGVINDYYVEMSRSELDDVLKGKASYNLEMERIKLSGDVESNPGPETNVQCESLRRMKELERKLIEMQERLKRFDNKAWREQDRKKTQRKNKRRVAQGLKSFCNNTGEAMNVMANGMGPVLDSIKSAMDSISQTGTEMKNLFEVPDHIDVVGSLLSLVQLVDAIFRKNLFACSLVCVQLARQCGVTLDAFMSLIPRVNGNNIEIVSENGETSRDAQSLFDCPKLVEDKYPLIAIGTTIVGVIALFSRGSCPPVKEMLGHLGIIGRAAQGFRAVRDFFEWIWEYAMGVYCSSFYGISYEEYKLTKEFPELGKICGGIKVADTIPKELIANSADICQQIVSMKAQLDDYVVEAAKIRSKNLTFIVKLRERLKEKYDLASTSPALANSIREEPVCVYLYGQPGVGKSVLTTVLTADYYKEFLAKRGVNYNSISHSRKAINEHWDGYCNQPILIVDDFANKKDNVMNPCQEFEELQYMVNTSEYPLWMADLSKKGVTYFNSELVLLSTNVRYPEVVHMVDPSSIFRRMHIWAEVVCKPEFGTATGKDKEGNEYYQYSRKVAAATLGIAEKDVPALMTNQYLIKLYKVSMDKQTGNPVLLDLNTALTYDEFYTYFKKVKKERAEINKSLSDAIRKRAGIDVVEDKKTEKMVLDQFKDIFDPVVLIDNSAKVLSGISPIVKECKKGQKDKIAPPATSLPKPHDLLPPVLTESEQKLFDAQFPDASGKEFLDAEDLDLDLLDISLPDSKFGKWKIRLTSLYEAARDRFMRTVKRIYELVSTGVKHTYGKMISVAHAFLSYVGSALGSVSSFFSLTVPINKVLILSTSLLIGYLGAHFYLNVPSACEFSLNLNECYTPCKRCDVCLVMQYEDKGFFDHFFRRIGVPQVKAALMRCQIWSEDYLSKILLRAEERVRVAERVYSSQPAVPRPTVYAQGLFGPCAIPGAVHRARQVGMNYSEAMNVIGSLCKFNCTFCPKFVSHTYNPLDNNDCIRVGKEISEAFFAQADLLVELPLPLVQGAKRASQGDVVRVEQCTNILTKNSVWLQAVTSSGSASKSTGTFIVGRTLVTTAHSVVNPEFDFKTLRIQNPNSRETLDIPFKDLKMSRIMQADNKPTDLMLITLPPVVPSRPKIVNKFIRAKDLDLLQEGDVILSGYRILNDRLVLNEQQTKRFKISTKTASYNEHRFGTCPLGDPCTHPIFIGNHIDYEIDTFPGCCGSLISAKNKNIPSKIIGFHVAGLTGEPALGVILTSELLQDAIQKHVTEHSLPDTYLINGRFPYSDS